MSLAKGLVCSIGCGAVGAAVWAGLTYATGWQLGLVSVVVGGAAGLGMARGNDGRGGSGAGVLAAVVALLSILGGNFAAAQVQVRAGLKEGALTDEDGVDILAQEIYVQMEEAGEDFGDQAWDEDSEWPAVVKYKAETRWEAMSEEARREFLASKEAEYRGAMEGAAPMMGLAAFLFMTLHWKSLIIIGLGVSTAFKIGAGDMKAEAAARGMTLDEPIGSTAAAPSPMPADPGRAGPVAAAKPRRGPAPGPAMEESASGGYRLPAMREPEADNLPSIEEIMRKHAAAAREQGNSAEAA